MIRPIRSAWKNTAPTSNAPIPRWRSAPSRHRVAPPRASSIRILRPRECPRNEKPAGLSRRAAGEGEGEVTATWFADLTIPHLGALLRGPNSIAFLDRLAQLLEGRGRASDGARAMDRKIFNNRGKHGGMGLGPAIFDP